MTRHSALVQAIALACATASCAGASPFCGVCLNGGAPPMQNTLLTLTCSGGGVISALPFVSYGTPTGDCGSMTPGTCAAANASAVVSALCLGQASCEIWPNTTTFGDPCFGTVKQLMIEAECSAGTGSAVCSVPSPSPPSSSVSVSVNVSSPVKTLKALPSLQVVAHHLLMRDSPIAATCWRNLASLGARHVRYVPWLPYPKLSVAELDPPSPLGYVCGPMAWVGGQSTPVTLDCGAGATISGVAFASYGTATGVCGGFNVNAACHAPNSSQVVQALCVGQQSCVIDFAAQPFGAPPCKGAYLAVQATCSGASHVHTYWNFTWPDSMMLDFWAAVDGDSSAPIPNFSTAPTWLYNPSGWGYEDDPHVPWYGYEQGGAAAANLTLLGDYYGRLLAWYTQGGFVDEGGVQHTSGYNLNVSIYEIFNEVDYEHGYTPSTYTQAFDAVVAGIRRWADPAKNIKFVGLSLPNIDSEAVVVQWAQYFLNASNHAPAAADALDFIGYHAYPTNGGYKPDPTTFAGMFAYVDSFVQKVQAVDAVIAQLSPTTRVALDESGTDMDNVLNSALAPPSDNPLYWVASGGYFAYLFASVSLASDTVFVVGQSQYMDAPGQEPSVTIMDWTTGNGTAKYWVLKMLIDEYALGDVFVATTSNSSDVFAQASTPVDGTPGDVSMLLVNKAFANQTVTFTVSSSVPRARELTACSAQVVDASTGLGPAYTVDCSAGTIQLAPYAVAMLNMRL